MNNTKPHVRWVETGEWLENDQDCPAGWYVDDGEGNTEGPWSTKHEAKSAKADTPWATNLCCPMPKHPVGTWAVVEDRVWVGLGHPHTNRTERMGSYADMLAYLRAEQQRLGWAWQLGKRSFSLDKTRGKQRGLRIVVRICRIA